MDPVPRRLDPLLLMSITIELINRCLSRDRTAQNELYRLLMPYLNMVCARYLYQQEQRQDILQESFIRIFRHLDQFDIQQASFKTWVTKIAINCCIRSNTKYEKRPTQELILPLHESLINPAVLRKMSNEDLINWLRKMPANYYEVFNLHVVDGFAHREIAEILGISEALSRQRLTRSRAWLKQNLPEEFRSRFRATMN